ncbi:hypothetical protein EOD41_11115 [Mucilaginibacter limnophilus]|uniref:Lipoprotein n=1 Tax=Mucilaginibacter limnophilus TaxID=1932778 RepID=A0A3S2Y0E8_9SPHI|nr:hypothetical protein [Mucilaginibacter limnophilus]RVU00545.1 hypothetical protein EOD41_11115 [Mucilaginibacter limnophilus]
MKYLNQLIISLSFCIGCSCGGEQYSDGYERNFETYEQLYDTTKNNLRITGAFPKEIISTDAYNLRNISYIKYYASVGTFNYSENKFYDSVFANTEIQIKFSLFERKAKENRNLLPNWFLNMDSLNKNNFTAIRIGSLYAARNLKEKKIYYVRSYIDASTNNTY